MVIKSQFLRAWPILPHPVHNIPSLLYMTDWLWVSIVTFMVIRISNGTCTHIIAYLPLSIEEVHVSIFSSLHTLYPHILVLICHRILLATVAALSIPPLWLILILLEQSLVPICGLIGSAQLQTIPLAQDLAHAFLHTEFGNEEVSS